MYKYWLPSVVWPRACSHCTACKIIWWRWMGLQPWIISQDARLKGSTYLLIISGMSWSCPYALYFIFGGHEAGLPAWVTQGAIGLLSKAFCTESSCLTWVTAECLPVSLISPSMPSILFSVTKLNQLCLVVVANCSIISDATIEANR